MDGLLWLVPVGVAIAAGGLLLLRATVSRLTRRAAGRNMSRGERDQLPRKEELLAFPTLREFYAPRDDFRREWDPDKRKRAPFAWASPYPKAVKAAWKAARKDSPSQLTMVKQQVAAAAQSFSLETLPDEEQPYNAGTDHFKIVLDLNGKPEEVVAGLAPTLKSELRLHSLDVGDNGGNFGTVHLIGHAEPPVDKLEKLKPGKRFFEENPATDPFKLPLAVKENGEPWSLELHHTLVYGLTGSGKSSPLNGVIAQLAPFVRDGLVELWLADLKGTLALPYEDSSVLSRVATDMESIERLVADFDQEMMARVSELKGLSREAREHFDTPTTERKLKVLVFDEMTGTIIRASQNRKSNLLTNATNITLLGRELNFLIVGAGQIVRRDILENLRVNLVNGVALRAESTGWSSFVLFGDHEDKRGAQFDASQIEVANKANGYKTAGIGYVKGEGGAPDRVRFANLSKAQIGALADSFPPRATVAPSDPVLVVPDADAEEGFVFEPKASSVGEPTMARLVHDERVFSPHTRTAPVQRSQVDELSRIAGTPTDKLERWREVVRQKLQTSSSVKGRAILDAIETELRVRSMLAKMPQVKEDPEDMALPDLEF